MRPIRALVDRSALRHNLARVRAAAPTSKVMAVIKANGYGHGAAQVAAALGDADSFAVASCSEGLELRNAGITKSIVLLEGPFFEGEVCIAEQHGFECILHAEHQLDWMPPAGGPPYWFKLDTGMHRLGFPPASAASLASRFLIDANEQFRGWVSHFACADEPERALNAKQAMRFDEAVGRYSGERSLANSAAILTRPTSHFEWVRPGIMLYGSSPLVDGDAEQDGLRPVMTLATELIAVKNLSAGETVGYGADWHAERRCRIGIAAVGYGDGYPRHAPSGTPVLVNGEECPLVGRVSMDMIAVDLSKQLAAKPGDPVTLWGQGLSADIVARSAGTIAYELFCNVAPRVPREYVNY